MKTNRRTFIGSGIALAGMAATTGLTSAQDIDAKAGALTKHVLPNLPYGYSELEPFIDAMTMELHHSKHHKAYVDGLNKAEAELAKARTSGDFSLIQHWSKQCAFHGGGHALHSLFWQCMAPQSKGGGTMDAYPIMNAIITSFGSFEQFKKQFTAAAIAVEGSGWALLHYRKDDGALIILQAENQHKLSSWNTVPILGIDVWEHAYYLKYQNKRADYVNAWWNIVNWKAVNAFYEQAKS
ncbi:MAG: superoxide dismutase [Ignavibacteriae bacterium]|jgi:Fe-Mn family superoxide dismutase|nr:superoxide dismutase [Ignavibacteriota bacterium]